MHVPNLDVQENVEPMMFLARIELSAETMESLVLLILVIVNLDVKTSSKLLTLIVLSHVTKISIVPLGLLLLNLQKNVKKLFVILLLEHVKQLQDQKPENVQEFSTVQFLVIAHKLNLELSVAQL